MTNPLEGARNVGGAERIRITRRRFLRRAGIAGAGIVTGVLPGARQASAAITLAGLAAAAFVLLLEGLAYDLAKSAFQKYLSTRVLYQFALGLRRQGASNIRGWVNPNLNDADVWYTVGGIRFLAQFRGNRIIRIIRA